MEISFREAQLRVNYISALLDLLDFHTFSGQSRDNFSFALALFHTYWQWFLLKYCVVLTNVVLKIKALDRGSRVKQISMYMINYFTRSMYCICIQNEGDCKYYKCILNEGDREHKAQDNAVINRFIIRKRIQFWGCSCRTWSSEKQWIEVTSQTWVWIHAYMNVYIS